MKKHLLILVLVLCTIAQSMAQGKDEELYKAVELDDKVQVEALLKIGADPNYINTGKWMVSSLLINAVNNESLETVKLLVAHKAQVDWRDFFGATALIYAAGNGNIKIAEFLIANGADTKVIDKQGVSVLDAAKQSENEKLVALIKRELQKSH